MAHASRATLPDDPAEWNGLFSRVGSELRTLAGAVNTLQHFLTPLVTEVVERDPSAITRLQDLDFLEQALQNLSEFMSCLDASTTLTDVSAVNTGVRTIRLSALAKRLSTADRGREPEPDASDLELF
jgi:hypothetical protein